MYYNEATGRAQRAPAGVGEAGRGQDVLALTPAALHLLHCRRKLCSQSRASGPGARHHGLGPLWPLWPDLPARQLRVW